MRNTSNKTTILGLLAAAFFAIEPLLENGSFDLKRDWPKLVCAAFSAIFGLLVKDADKTGLPEKDRRKRKAKNVYFLSLAWALLFGALLFIIMSCTGCRTVKHKVRHDKETTIKDTTSTEKSQSVSLSDSFQRTIEKSDTAVGIPGKTISLSLDPGTPIDTTVTDGSHSLHVYTDKDGRQRIDCNADSLTIVIRKLQKELIYSKSHKDSTKTRIEYKDREVTKTDTRTEYKEVGTPWWQKWLNWIIAAIIGILIWEIIKKIYSIIQLKSLLK